MLSIEQYDSAEERVKNLKDDSKTLIIRRKQLIGIAEGLEKHRKKRLLAVLKEVNTNFKGVYNKLTKGKAELRLENPSEPFNGGLEMWCQPPGKSARSRLQALSGGEKSMAALALIFAIQDYDPSPFYYFDEVDQNLDAFNAERIAQLCRQRSVRAQFIMVTLRKVSLQLADHHIGITHAGDGCSRRIANFDKDKAIQVGEAAEAENKAMNNRKSAMLGRMGKLPTLYDMPNVPEEIETPVSLGGTTAKENEDSGVLHEDLGALKERAEEMKEEIVEHQEYREKIEDAVEEDIDDKEQEDILEQD
jgi:chromosome segregation protein